jgi:hypothetical protein
MDVAAPDGSGERRGQSDVRYIFSDAPQQRTERRRCLFLTRARAAEQRGSRRSESCCAIGDQTGCGVIRRAVDVGPDARRHLESPGEGASASYTRSITAHEQVSPLEQRRRRCRRERNEGVRLANARRRSRER